jgi:hypothetical protein
VVYKIVAEKENETVRSERTSLLVAVAKVCIWADEGWHVVVTDAKGTQTLVRNSSTMSWAPSPGRHLSA